METPETPGPLDAKRPFADLAKRTVFAALFATIAFAAVWFGGGWSLGFAAIAGAMMVREWRRISLPGIRFDIASIQTAAVVGAVVLVWLGSPLWALVFLVSIAGAGWIGDHMLDRPGKWSFIGAVYIGLGAGLFLMIRELPEQGLSAIVWLLLIVVSTDVGAYFAGRMIGGPKLWPAVSPGKTWSGAIGGAALAVFAAVMFKIGAGAAISGASMLVALILSAVSQMGDLAESAYKRKFGVKDSGRALPGHGGVLDRLDGLLAATLVLGLLALARPEDPVWAW
ncbi:MAG: phosphatidate cytidylyltransferase [Pseudomonadota bacterium]